MALAQTLESSRSLAGLALFAVMALAKGLVLFRWGELLPSELPVLFWQDAVVGLFFFLFFSAIRNAVVCWTVYVGGVLYAAANVPLQWSLSSPFTIAIFHAASGPLADSIRHQATAAALCSLLIVIAAAVVLPLALNKSRSARRILFIAMVATSLGGLASGDHHETFGLERNPMAALVSSAFPRISPHPQNMIWQAPLHPGAVSANTDLRSFHGAARGRNIVMILLESTGASYLKPYGSTNDPMPHLTRLSEQSVLFENACSVYPESIKGLFSVLTSQFPPIEIPPERFARAAGPSLAGTLQQAGYRTALFHSGRFMYLGMDAVVQNRGFEVLQDAGGIGGARESSFGIDEETSVAKILSWIDSLPRAQRFFVTYLPISGHHPYDSPPPHPFDNRSEEGRYLNALHYTDGAIALLMEGLQRRDLYNQTLFVIFGDHGEAFGQHPGNFGHTLFLNEENIHVPYLILLPGILNHQIRARQVVSLVDTGPTILDLAGLAPPAESQGVSMLEPGDRMALFLTDYSLRYVGLREGSRKFIYEIESHHPQLFDLCRDPIEQTNIAALHPDWVREYEDRLLAWSASQKAKFTLKQDTRASTFTAGFRPRSR